MGQLPFQFHFDGFSPNPSCLVEAELHATTAQHQQGGPTYAGLGHLVLAHASPAHGTECGSQRRIDRSPLVIACRLLPLPLPVVLGHVPVKHPSPARKTKRGKRSEHVCVRSAETCTPTSASRSRISAALK